MEYEKEREEREDFISTQELSRILGISTRSLMSSIKKGDIPYSRIGERGRYRFLFSEVEKALQKHRTPDGMDGLISIVKEIVP